jgi:DNA modification methylase
MSTTNNKLFYGDNLEVLRKHIKTETVDLCYIDPPFNSKRNYNQIYNNIGTEDKAQAQAFVDTWTWNSIANEGFAEITSNFNGLFTKQVILLLIGLEKVLGKGSLLSYLVSMTQRITEIHRVLKPTGSFYLHCDPTASHYLKLILDAIFCSQGGDFRNEIVWHYSDGTAPKKDFKNKHDVIFRYSKSKDYIYNEVRLPVLNLKRYNLTDDDGRRYFEDGHNKKWYADQGRACEDVWTYLQDDKLRQLNSMAKERLGYPTQKPESLLERIIQASSNEGDVILDAYCGCGTTIAVAQKLHRNWIGIDITYQSISLILKRLEDSFGKSVLDRIAITGIPEDFEAAVALANKQDDRVRKEFEKWIVLSYSNNRAAINDKKGGDGGIDGTAFMVDLDEENQQDFKQVIFSVKSNKSLSPTVIRDLFGTMEREKAAIGYLLTLYKMPNLVKESAKYGNYENKLLRQKYPKIEVISVEEILQGKKMHLPTAIDIVKDAERKVKDGIVGKLL